MGYGKNAMSEVGPVSGGQAFFSAAPQRERKRRRSPARALALAAVAFFLRVPPAAAELMQKDRGDVRYEVREYFRSVLPYGWWATDAVMDPWGWRVDLHIPDNWGGNPASAAMSLCPPRGSVVWTAVRSLFIHPYWQSRRWAGFQCRKP